MAALRDGGGHTEAMVREYGERRHEVLAGLGELQGVRLRPPAGAFYAFPRLELPGVTGEQAAIHLLEDAGVALVPGGVFGDGFDDYVRISYAVSGPELSEGLSGSTRSSTPHHPPEHRPLLPGQQDRVEGRPGQQDPSCGDAQYRREGVERQDLAHSEESGRQHGAHPVGREPHHAAEVADGEPVASQRVAHEEREHRTYPIVVPAATPSSPRSGVSTSDAARLTIAIVHEYTARALKRASTTIRVFATELLGATSHQTRKMAAAGPAAGTSDPATRPGVIGQDHQRHGGRDDRREHVACSPHQEVTLARAVSLGGEARAHREQCHRERPGERPHEVVEPNGTLVQADGRRRAKRRQHGAIERADEDVAG